MITISIEEMGGKHNPLQKDCQWPQRMPRRADGAMRAHT